MDEKTSNMLVQLAVISLQGIFQMMKVAGKSEAEIDQLFWEEKGKFEARKPEDLPDV